MPNNQIKSLTVDGVTYDIVDETSGYMKGMTILSYGNSTWQDFLIAYNEQKVVYCRASSNSNPASGEQTRLAFMAYVNDADTPTEVEFQYYRSVNTHTEAQQGDQVFVYKLTSAGNWTVTTREASVKVAVSGDLTGSYSNGVYTIGGDIPTIAVEPKITTGVNIADITVDETTYELYAPTGGGGSVESVAISNATNGGLTVSGSPITSSGTISVGHSNVLASAQTTQAVYPIKIDKNGHISAYGSAVNIDNFVKNYYGENISGYIDTTTSDGYGIIEYRDLSFNEDNTAQIQYGTTSHNTSSFISLSADDINIWGNINAESNKIINLGTPTASTDAATKDYVDSNIPSSAASSTTGVSISDHSTGSVTGVQSSVTTASKVTLGLAISVPNVTAVGSGSFTQGSFSGGSLAFAIDSTDSKQLNITFTAATHGADSHTHTPPTLGTAKSIPNVTTVSDVTVPIKDTAATTVVTSATHTVTDNGHTHSLS